MAFYAFLTCASKRAACIIGTSILVLLVMGAVPASAQWTALPARGQVTRAVAKEPAVLAIAKSARKIAVGHRDGKSVAFYNPDTAALLIPCFVAAGLTVLGAAQSFVAGSRGAPTYCWPVRA